MFNKIYKIYTLCEGQTLLIFFGIKRAILNLQGCKTTIIYYVKTSLSPSQLQQNVYQVVKFINNNDNKNEK